MPIISNLEKAKQFNSSERIISQYILKNKDLILEMSIQELALNTNSSTSTIVRLCRKIGLKGYKDFKIKFSAELLQHNRKSRPHDIKCRTGWNICRG
ncbi:MurR/RpiR family transcriptional regulator [Clostridium sp. Marseille-P2415]|uniref:MurR/RpiR family transcriptional regulator n=1 Tax=Clostridium sp. Marseille-P2415 TaxID=1805471 RepID=UPI000988912A|nr:MurR/RpiR family transcriptional regulator [Clostridium sp. Marseille-P2415]